MDFIDVLLLVVIACTFVERLYERHLEHKEVMAGKREAEAGDDTEPK